MDSTNNSTKKYMVAVSVLGVLVVALGIVAGFGFYKASVYKGDLEKTYMRALQNTATNISNISTDLEKGIYSSSPSNISMLSAKLWRESGSAKAHLAALPVTELNLENTYKFLSQVGDYAMSISTKAAKGQDITDEEMNNLSSLLDYSKTLSQKVSDIERAVSTGKINLETIRMEAESKNKDSGGETEDTSANTMSITEVESSFTDYPKLIYDGPFSDHILEKKSEMLASLQNISRDEGRKIAAKALRVSTSQITDGYDENSSTPSFTFSTDNSTAAITKQGGLICYMIRSATPERTIISTEEALNKAAKYLESLGIKDMKETYYENANNILTINYAYEQGYEPKNVICYTDLIKVGINMENGDVVSFDARGFIVNHKKRDIPTDIITEKEAEKTINKNLRVIDWGLALIPTSGKNEALTYEFLTEATNGQRILEYIDAKTGEELQQLLLYENENGTLTK